MKRTIANKLIAGLAFIVFWLLAMDFNYHNGLLTCYPKL